MNRAGAKCLSPFLISSKAQLFCQKTRMSMNGLLIGYLWERETWLSEKLSYVYSHEKVLKLLVYSREKV